MTEEEAYNRIPQKKNKVIGGKIDNKQTDAHTESGNCKKRLSAPFIGKCLIERRYNTQHIADNADGGMQRKAFFKGIKLPRKGLFTKNSVTKDD